MDKTWMDVLIQIIEMLVGLMVTAGIPYLFALLRSRVQHNKAQQYLDRAEEYLTSAVAMVNQTFVDQLKKDGRFDTNNQAAAFNMAMDAWLEMMSEDMKNVVTDEVGNFTAWAEAQIEARVQLLKEGKGDIEKPPEG